MKFSGSKHLIVFGGGRMGLSHAAMAGLLEPNLQMTIVEPSFKTRIFLRLITGKNIRVTDNLRASDIKKATHAIIASPPKYHFTNFIQLRKAEFGGRLLIEKPVFVSVSEFLATDKVMSGYVLRHAHFWKSLKAALHEQVVRKISIQLETNQDFGLSSGSWRIEDTFPGQSLISEFGSHCINLLIDLAPIETLSISVKEFNKVILTNNDNVNCTIELLAKSPNVRKSVYTILVETDVARFRTDFYSLEVLSFQNKEMVFESLASAGVNARAYLRGVEFSAQMEIFMGSSLLDSKDITDAVATDVILKKLEEDRSFQK